MPDFGAINTLFSRYAAANDWPNQELLESTFTEDATFTFHLGDAALGRKDYAAAERLYQDVIKLEPNNAAAFNNLAWALSRQDKTDALGYAERANQIAPNQPAFMDTLATILAEGRQYDKAITLQRKALERQPTNSALKLTLAKLYIKAGDKAEARRELDKLASMGPRFAAQAEVSTLLKSL